MRDAFGVLFNHASLEVPFGRARDLLRAAATEAEGVDTDRHVAGRLRPPLSQDVNNYLRDI